jgi:hypothetical protein
MDSFTRRSFVESLGVTLGLGSIASAAEGQLSTSDIPAPDTPPDPKGLRFRLVHLDFHTSSLITDVAVDFDAREAAPLANVKIALRTAKAP